LETLLFNNSTAEYLPWEQQDIAGYDIIGDIHGHAIELALLLGKLGYCPSGNHHPENRKLIFLGDFIDRGSENKKTIETIRMLIEKDLAKAVMGNHEYNAICYHELDQNDRPLREHSQKNISQHEVFLNEYKKIDERLELVEWFKALPLFLDLQALRIVHACWHHKTIDYIQQKYDNKLTKEFLHQSVIKGTEEYNAIEILLKGPEYPLKSDLSFLDADGHKRINFRVKWWKNEMRTLGDAAILTPGALVENLTDPLEGYINSQDLKPYPHNDPPVFFGHYSFLHKEERIGDNTACLDFNIIKGNSLACYRWNYSDKDEILNEKKNIVSVEYMNVPHGK